MRLVSPLGLATKALALTLALAACRGDGSKLSGTYVDGATIVVGIDADRAELRRGQGSLVLLRGTERGVVPIEGTTKQRDLYLELSALPVLGTRIDLATAPLRARYEGGSQKLTYVSNRARGWLMLDRRDGDAYLGEIDVTFDAPSLGTGEQSHRGAVRLERFDAARLAK